MHRLVPCQYCGKTEGTPFGQYRVTITLSKYEKNCDKCNNTKEIVKTYHYCSLACFNQDMDEKVTSGLPLTGNESQLAQTDIEEPVSPMHQPVSAVQSTFVYNTQAGHINEQTSTY